jgi:hypothetical protein
LTAEAAKAGCHRTKPLVVKIPPTRRDGGRDGLLSQEQRMVSAFEELQEFENSSDAAVAALSIWRQPIRSILSLIYLSADDKYVGRRFKRTYPRNDDVGTAIITRMSYVVSFFGKCSRQIGADIDDAMSVVDGHFLADIEQMLGYAHFCEIMPLVRRGFLSVGRQPSGFILKHPSAEFMNHEENDILMSEMVLPHELEPPPYPLENCKRMFKAWPRIPADDLIKVLKEAYDHYIDNVFELPLLDDKAFEESFSFSRTDFIRVRAALMAYANFCLGMADAAELLSVRAFTSHRQTVLQREVREWAAPLLNRNHIIGVAAGVSNVKPLAAERIVNLFTLNLDNIKGSGAGEGFFPPFQRFENALLFSPHAVKRTMPERNLLYAMVQTDREKFDNIVSCHLEPALLEDAFKILSELPGVEIRKNVNWEKGEIDILAFHGASNSAFQLQAKAGVAPQGARMVAQVQSRTLEAAKQVERFLGLSSEEKDRICSAAIGREVSNVSWCSGILVRSCFGTENAWKSISAYVPLNPILLRATVKIISKAGAFSFADFGNIVKEELERLRSSAIIGWENKNFTLFGETIELPLLELNYPVISDFRNNAMS